MSGPPGLLSAYNSLTDKHLTGYFSNARIRRHLQRSGLISRTGRLIPEKEYRLNALRRDHQRYVQECLARAIFHKVLDMECRHQLEIRRKLETAARKERVQRMKVEQSRRRVEGFSPMYSPHPPLGPRNSALCPLVAEEAASRSQLRVPGPAVGCCGGRPPPLHRAKQPACSKVSWRPNTAPVNMQRPAHLQPLRCAAPKPHGSKQKGHSLEHHQLFATGGERSGLRLMNSVEYRTGVSPYQLPVINNYMIPVPPHPLQKGDKSGNVGRTGALRARQLRPITAPNLEQLLTKNSGGFPKSSLRSNALVTMFFLGKSVRLSYDDTDYRDEIKVYQQHCGGENLCVYKGKLLEGETFQFISRRHHGFPFSLTFFLNGLQVDRLSCCCEYKHQKRSRTRGRRGYFRFLSVEGASPCYRCIIAMGLDKKPSPPKREMQDHEETHTGSWGDGASSKPSKTSAEPSKTSPEQNPGKVSVLVILPDHEASAETVEDEMETGQEYRKEEKKKLPDCESEDSQEDTGKNEYDEDFEADEEVNEEGQTGDQMNRMSKSSSDDKKHNLDYEKESTNSSQKPRQTYDSETDESDGYSDSDSEDDKPGGRLAHSLSSISTQYSSDNDSHAETMKDGVKDTKDYDIKRASDNVARVQHGNESGENKLLRVEENQETFALEKEGIDEEEKENPEDLAAREDTAVFHDNVMATQRQSPEVNGELRPAGSVESHTGEDRAKNGNSRRDDGEESLVVPLESSVLEAEDCREESAGGGGAGVFEDHKPVQEEIAKAIGNDNHVNSDPEPCDSGADEEEENVTSTEHDASEAPDGAFLAQGTRTLDEQKEAEQVVQGGQVAGDRQALEKDDVVAEGGDAGTEEAGELAQVGDVLPMGDTTAALQAEGQRVVEEPAPQESPVAEDPQGQGTGKGMDSGTEAADREQDVVMEGTESKVALREQAPGGQELAAAGRETDRAASEGEEEDGEVSGGEETAEEDEAEAGAKVEEAEAVGLTGSAVKEELGEMVSKEEEAMEEGGFVEKGIVVSPVSEGEEVMEDANMVENADMVEESIAGVDGPEEEEAVEEAVSEGDEAVEEAVSEGEEDVEKPEALLETSEDTNICRGEAAPGEATPGEDFIKPHEFPQVEAAGEERSEMGEAAVGAPETSRESGADESSVLRAGDVVGAAVQPDKCPLLQIAPGLEAPVDAGEDPRSEGSSQLEDTTTAEEEEGSAQALLSGKPTPSSTAGSAVEDKPDGGTTGDSVETDRAEVGAAGEVPGQAAVPGELVGEEVAVAGDSRVGDEVVAQEGVTAAACGGQSGTGVSAAEGVAAEGRGAAGDLGRHRGGVSNGAAAVERGVNQEGRELAPAGAEGQAEIDTADVMSPQHGEMFPGEQPMAETCPSSPAQGAGGAELGGTGSAGGEGPCLGTCLQLAAPRTGANKDSAQEGTEPVGMKAEGEQPGLHGNMQETAAAGVWDGAQDTSVDSEQSQDGPVAGSLDTPAAADQRSRGPGEDVVNPEAAVEPSVQPQNEEDTLL
ncbi:glutamate-rich protein 3 isoform A [Patagioenas fasciata monilis]|uniref:Glutamate-rich protein 3 isoform A n=1 Tax=Patagioenas fasciata monilis TaxID=372326 RepID=A0A1V4JXH8_PATFA|nr:glutamate-rich protein 3 isoform A [Patagioenas fasciata monilis]